MVWNACRGNVTRSRLVGLAGAFRRRHCGIPPERVESRDSSILLRTSQVVRYDRRRRMRAAFPFKTRLIISRTTYEEAQFS